MNTGFAGFLVSAKPVCGAELARSAAAAPHPNESAISQNAFHCVPRKAERNRPQILSRKIRKIQTEAEDELHWRGNV